MTGGVCPETVLLHLNSDFSDSAVGNKTFTPSGSSAVNSDQSKFGGGSAVNVRSTSDFFSTPFQADFANGANDFVFDFWLWFDTIHPDTYVTTMNERTNDTGWSQGTIEVTTASVNFGIFDTSNHFVISNFVVSTSTWYHIRAGRRGNIGELYINGNTQGTVALSGSLQSDATHGWTFGKRNAPTGPNHLTGRIDEPRFQRGLAVNSSNFTPPIKEYCA